MDQHYILCGLGKVGVRVLEHLRAAGARVVVVDNGKFRDESVVAGVTVVAEDCRSPEALQKAGVDRARGVLILTSDDLTNLSTTLMVRNLNPTVRVVVRLFNQTLISRLGSAVENVYALSTSALAGPLLALIARTGEAHGSFKLKDGRSVQVADFTLAAGSTLVGRNLAELAELHRATLVAHRPVGQSLRLLRDVDGKATLAVGDQVALCGNPGLLAPLLAQGENESLPDLLWAGMVRRFSRVFLRGLSMVDVSVKVCTAALVIVILVGVLVFHYGMERDEPWIDALYRTVSLMATGADMRGNELERGAWQKAFMSGLRLVGMALTAAFTAIFTNYLIRANLGGALEVRRIPDGGHVIVCGLGNVGFRAVEELHSQDEPVVVIERRVDNEFIATVRRLGVPVIIGDATVQPVLRQARAATARAVVAACSNDLVNLEIALLVRELAPRQRVVLRLADSNLAKTLRQAANVRLALSVPELTAPAFVARLFGERARGLFFVQGRLVIAYELQVPEGSPLAGQSVETLAADWHFVPFALTSADNADRAITPQSFLAAGDRLTVLLGQQDLQRLLVRESADESSKAG